MVEVKTLTKAIIKVLRKHKERKFSYQPGLQQQLIINSEQTQFLLLTVGWDKGLYSHYVAFHLEIKNGKVWLHENRTDTDIVEELEEAGIPSDKVILHLVEEQLRPSSISTTN